MFEIYFIKDSETKCISVYKIFGNFEHKNKDIQFLILPVCISQ